MKKFITIIITAFICHLTTFAQVHWLNTIHNFGPISEENGTVTTTFTFINHSTQKIAIIHARASCGCTEPHYPKDPVAPGDTATITVTYDPTARPGRFSKSITVTFSDDTSSKLYIKGSVIGSPKSIATRFPQQCTPALNLAKNIVMAGDINKGQTRTIFLDGYNRSTDSISPLITNLPPYIDYNISPLPVPPGEQFSIIFYFKSAQCPQYGPVTDTITILPSKNYPQHCTIPTLAVIKEDFSKLSKKQLQKAPRIFIHDNTIDFGKLTSHTTTKQFKIKNIGKSTLDIRRIYTTDPAITIATGLKSLKPGKETTVSVTADPKKITGALLSTRITIISSDPYNPQTEIKAAGEL